MWVKSPSWNTGHASDRRPATCLFFFLISWGHICTDRLLDDYSAGLCISQGQCRPQVYTIWNALDFTTSITYLTSTYSKRTCYVQTPPFNVWSCTLRKHAESKTGKNKLLFICIISGFVILVTPPPYLPTRQSRMCMSLFVQCLHIDVFHHSRML